MGDTEPDYDTSIHFNPDARAWAKFYTETRTKFTALNPGEQYDTEEMMLTWFANAMMAMHDSLRQRAENHIAEKANG